MGRWCPAKIGYELAESDKPVLTCVGCRIGFYICSNLVRHMESF